MTYHLPDIKQFFRSPRNIAISFLLIIWSIIVITNFPWKTGFTGWDNLHPEYNFSTNLNRAFFGVWQAHEGLGHTGGHGYAATLLHTVITWAASLVVPTMYIRSIFTFAMLAIGMIGCFVLTEQLLKKKSSITQTTGAFFASIYYLLNFSTVQQFSTQLEAFIVHYAVIPWLLFFATKLMSRWSRKDMLCFLGISVASTIQGFIPPLFVTYGIALVILVGFATIAKPTRYHVGIASVLLIATCCINAYWLLPVAHFTITSINNFLQSTNNILSTQSWIETNDAYGTLPNLAILKGFPSQALNTVDRGIPVYVFQEWLQHLNNPFIVMLGWTSFAIVCLGFISLCLFALNANTLWIVIIGLLFFSMLATRIPVLSHVQTFTQFVPILRQAFRAEFTKISIILSLCYSVYFGYGVIQLLQIIQSIARRLKINTERFLRVGYLFMVVILFVFSIVFALPTFQGHFLYDREKITVPSAYMQLFSFFQSQPTDGRIMLLPQGDHWGWDYYTWGYTGSGFSWFGIPQPILERAFDVWSPYNENYYWELSYALYSQNQKLLTQLIDKYDIKWIIFDPSMVSYFGSKNVYYNDKILAMLNGISSLKAVQSYPIGDPQKNVITVYQHTGKVNSTSDIQVIQKPPTITQSFSWLQQDKAYENLAPYISSSDFDDTSSSSAFFFPFRSLFSQRQQSELAFTVNQNATSVSISAQIPKTFQAGVLHVPTSPDQFVSPNTTSMVSIPTSLSLDGKLLVDGNQKKSTSAAQLLPYTEGLFEAKFSTNTYFDTDQNSDISPNVHRCDTNASRGTNIISTVNNNTRNAFRLDNTNSSTCYDLFIPTISHKSAYLLSITSKHISGSPLTLQIINSTSTRIDTTAFLQKSNEYSNSYFIVPPMESDGVGYSFRISNESKTNQASINEIGQITITPIPYTYLSSLIITTFKGGTLKGVYSNEIASISATTAIRVEHPNTAWYRVTMGSSSTLLGENNQDSSSTSSENTATLVLSQAYDEGWKAYILNKQINKYSNNQIIEWAQETFPFIFGTQIKNHVLVNNWENGWVLAESEIYKSTNDKSTNKNTTIILFYWPQLLQWIGFALLPIPFLLAIRKNP